MAEMLIRGRSQREVATRYGVTVRTVHNWQKQIRKRGLIGVRRSTPEAMLAETDHLHATIRATLLRELDTAKATGDRRMLLSCVKQLRGLDCDRYAVREKVGYFDAYRLAPAQPSDEGADETRALHKEMGRYLAYLHTGDERHLDPDDDADGGDDDSGEPLF